MSYIFSDLKFVKDNESFNFKVHKNRIMVIDGVSKMHVSLRP